MSEITLYSGQGFQDESAGFDVSEAHLMAEHSDNRRFRLICRHDHLTPAARSPDQLAVVERIWHTQDSEGQILALAFRLIFAASRFWSTQTRSRIDTRRTARW